jgi:hypothetical protein
VNAEPVDLTAASARLRGKPGRPRKAPTTPEEQAARSATLAARKRERVDAVTPRLLDVDQAARYYGDVSVWTIRDLVASGRLPRVRLPLAGEREVRRLLIDVRDLDRLIELGKESGEALGLGQPVQGRGRGR